MARDGAGLVTRMAGFGAAFKSYCITIVTAVCGFSISLQKPSIAALALLPTLVFAMADAQYLRVERRYRALFDQVRGEEFSSMPTFDTSRPPGRRAA